MIVLPHKESYDTFFNMEYSTDGILRSDIEVIYNQYFTGDGGMTKFIFASICAVLIVLLILGVIIWKTIKCCKGNDSDVQKIHTIPDINFDEKGNMHVIQQHNTG